MKNCRTQPKVSNCDEWCPHPFTAHYFHSPAMGVFASQPSLMLNALTIQHQPCACRSYVPYPSPSTSPLIPCHDSHAQGGTQLQLQKLAIEMRVSHAYILHITFTEGICDFVTQKLVMFLIKSHNVFPSIVPVAFLNSSTPHAIRQNLQA